jgi:ADP-ribosylglycohydrolase
MKSGVFSAGNGPAMRSAILGACFGEYPDKLRDLVNASTRMTHTDPKAEQGALAIALTTHFLCQNRPLSLEHFYEFHAEHLGSDAGELLSLIEQVLRSVEAGETTAVFAARLGLEEGVSGYILHTVPVAIHAAISHADDLEGALQAVLECGGDTDTVAAITGGMVGACLGSDGIPERLKRGVWEPIYSSVWLVQLGKSLADTVLKGVKQRPQPTRWILLPFRNVLFLVVVLLHGFRRLLPPYNTRNAQSSRA